MPRKPHPRNANPIDRACIAAYRAAYALDDDGKRVVLIPGGDLAAANAGLKRLAERYWDLALGERDNHAPTIDAATVESELWDALGGAKSFTYDPDRASLAAWLRTVLRNALINLARHPRFPALGAETLLDETVAAPDDREDEDVFSDLLRAIHVLTSRDVDGDLLREVIDVRIIEPARRGVAPESIAHIQRAHDLPRHRAREVVGRAEEIARDAAANIGLAIRTS